MMTNQTRFDLTVAIENWRNELAAQPNLASDDRRELETHLRDAVAGFQRRGLNDEESFLLARHRVGQPQQLGEEFVKADPAKIWRERIFWMWLALFLVRGIDNIAGSLLQFMSANHHSIVIMIDLLWMLYILVPLAMILLVIKGNLAPILSKLMLHVENGKRLAVAAVAFTAAALVIAFALETLSYWRMKADGAGLPPPSVGRHLVEWTYELLACAVLVWLLPVQNQKTPKRA